MRIAKKIMLIIGIVLLVLISLIAVFIVYNSRKPAVPTDYTQTVETGGEIEAKYIANGTYEVSYFEEAVLQGFGKYVLFYPSKLENTEKAWPVVVVANGSGCSSSQVPF